MTLATDDLVIVRNAPDQRLLEEGVRPASSDQEPQPCPWYQIHRLVLQLNSSMRRSSAPSNRQSSARENEPPGSSWVIRQREAAGPASRIASHRI